VSGGEGTGGSSALLSLLYHPPTYLLFCSSPLLSRQPPYSQGISLQRIEGEEEPDPQRNERVSVQAARV
jgi:hypothetical protein